MSSLNDVALSTISTNQVLQWNGTKWSNATISLVTALSGLTDTSISTPVDGNSLYYSSFLNKWYNGPNKMMNYDTSAYITQSNYTGSGTSLSPSYYSYNTWFSSLVCDNLKYDVKRKMLEMYEKLINFKFEQIRKEKDETERNKIEVEIHDLINMME